MAFIFLMYCGSAFSVWSRSPPASWKSTEAPLPDFGVAVSMMLLTPGCFQSSLSVSMNTLV